MRKANRTSWKPGQSGNPAGRPPKPRCLTDALRSLLEAPITLSDGQVMARAQALAALVVQRALTGHRWAVELCFDRLEGKVPQPLEWEYDDEPVLLVSPVAVSVAEPAKKGKLDDTR